MAESTKVVMSGSGDPNRYRSRLLTSFGFFLVFFVFYVGVAILVTPPFKEIAGIPLAGIPLGLVLSLMIFPVSWGLAYLYFKVWR